MHGHDGKPTQRKRNASAFTLIEITISILVLTIILLSSAAAFSNSIAAGEQAQRTTQAAIFIETVTEDLSALSYADILALNGNRIFDANDANDSRFGVDVSAFQVAVDLIQVQLILVDLRTGNEMGRLTTLRSDW